MDTRDLWKLYFHKMQAEAGLEQLSREVDFECIPVEVVEGNVGKAEVEGNHAKGPTEAILLAAAVAATDATWEEMEFDAPSLA